MRHHGSVMRAVDLEACREALLADLAEAGIGAGALVSDLPPPLPRRTAQSDRAARQALAAIRELLESAPFNRARHRGHGYER